MGGRLHGTVIAALVAAFAPVAAAAQNTSADSVLRRIEILERTTLDLQLRVRELEAMVKSESTRDLPLQVSYKSQDLRNWRRLRRGMSMDEVRASLGEPDKVEAGVAVTHWYWSFPTGGMVYFDSRSGKLDGWSEPSR